MSACYGRGVRYVLAVLVLATAAASVAGASACSSDKPAQPAVSSGAAARDGAVASEPPVDNAIGADRSEPRGDLRTEGRPDGRVDSRVAQGGELYAKYCALCHGADAKGYVADNAPSLVSDTFSRTASDDFLIVSIALGRPGTSMAGYSSDKGGPLSAVEIRQIVAWLRSKGVARQPLAATPAAGDPERGAKVYAEKCVSCHGTKKERGPAVDLSNEIFLSVASDAFLRAAIAEGRPGAGTPPLVMPPWKDTLTPEQIDDIVAMLRSWTPAGRAVQARPGGKPVKPPPTNGPVVINPKGSRPAFTLRENRFVPVDAVKQALDKKQRIVIVDARPASDWIRSHIPGSISIPYHDMARIKDLPKDGTWIITYCACPHHASGIVLDELRRQGFPNTAILDEGVLVWEKRGYPVEPWE
jgi:cytochrome c oxidase cbb3-type subunit 3/ubiquinol-cytochrome c reductase cytochrome c subunit